MKLDSANYNPRRIPLELRGTLFREDYLLSTPASRAFLFFAAIFVVSPIALYFNRVSSLIVVFGLLFGALFFLALPKLAIRRVPTPIDFPSAVFVGYLLVSCVMGLLAGHLISNTLADLVSPLEIYFSFQIAKRLHFPTEVRAGWLKWIFIFATIRAVWQVFTTLAHIHILAPIYDVSVVMPTGTIGNFTFDRPIDPVSGMLFAIAVLIYIFGIERKWSLATAVVTAVVLILGLTRSEWIAGILAICTSMFYAGRLRRAFKALIIIAFLLVVAFMASNDLYNALRDRLVTHTIEQFTSSEEDLNVGALRILELNTAFEEFKSAPIIGHGLGSWFGTLVSYNGRDLTFVQLHNSYLNLLTNTGIVGLLLLMVVVLRVRRFLLIGLRHPDSTVRTLFCVAVGPLVWYGIFMAFEPIYAAYHLPVLIGLLWGLAAALSITSCDVGDLKSHLAETR